MALLVVRHFSEWQVGLDSLQRQAQLQRLLAVLYILQSRKGPVLYKLAKERKNLWQYNNGYKKIPIPLYSTTFMFRCHWATQCQPLSRWMHWSPACQCWIWGIFGSLLSSGDLLPTLRLSTLEELQIFKLQGTAIIIHHFWTAYIVQLHTATLEQKDFTCTIHQIELQISLNHKKSTSVYL